MVQAVGFGWQWKIAVIQSRKKHRREPMRGAVVSIVGVLGVFVAGCQGGVANPNLAQETSQELRGGHGHSPQHVVHSFFASWATNNPEAWISFVADDDPPPGHTCQDADAEDATGRVPGCACYSNTGVLNPRGELGGCYSGKDEVSFFFRTFVP